MNAFFIDLSMVELIAILIPILVPALLAICTLAVVLILDSRVFCQFVLWLHARRETRLAKHYGADRQLWYRIGMPRMTYKGGN